MPRLWVTWFLVATNTLVFVVMIVTDVALMDPSFEQLLEWGGDYAPLTMQGDWWRILTNSFVHMGHVHLAANMWCLSVLGWRLEPVIGHGAFGCVYVFALVIGALSSTAFAGDWVFVGASGAVFGLCGALLACMQLLRGKLPPGMFRDARIGAMVYIGYTLASSLLWPNEQDPATETPLPWPLGEHVHHAGGLLAGFFATWLTCRRPNPGAEPVNPPVLRTNYRVAPLLAVIVGLAFAAAVALVSNQTYYRAHRITATIDAAVAREDYEAALRGADQLVAIYPKNAYYHNQRAVHLANLQRFEAALAPIIRAIELDNTEADYHDTHAWVLSSLSRHEEGAVAARRAVMNLGSRATAHERLLHCLDQLDDNQSYLEAAQLAVIHHDHNAEFYNHLSWALYRVRRLTSSRREAERSLELDPGNEWATAHLTLLRESGKD